MSRFSLLLDRTSTPLGFEGGDTNLYRYVGNNPINRIDPSGNQETSGSDADFLNEVMTAYAEIFGTNDRILAAAQRAGVVFRHEDIDWSGGKLYSLFNRGTALPWPYSAPELKDSDVIYLDDSLTDPWIAAVQLRAALWEGLGKWPKMRTEYGILPGQEVEDLETLIQSQREYWVQVAYEFKELVLTGVSVIDVVDIGLAANDVLEGEEGSFLRAGIAVIPFVPAGSVKRIGKKAFIGGDVILKLSADLATALKKAEIPNPYPVAAQAHHIFPVKFWGTELGRKLHGWGIDLNGVDNGMWLPAKDFDGRLAPLHRGDHTKNYYDYVYDSLSRATTKERVIATLNIIRAELEGGKIGL